MTATAVGGNIANITDFHGSNDNTDKLIGTNGPTTWNVSGGDAGDINGQFFFNGVENLSGGNDADLFIMGPAGFVEGTISGGASANTLNYSLRSTGVVTNLQLSASTSIGTSFNQIGTVIGSSNLNNTLIGINQTNVWMLAGSNGGTLNSVFTTVNFQNYQNLTGGTMSDTFQFKDGSSISGVVNGGGGNDTLDYSGRTANIVTNLQTNSSTAIGGGFSFIENLVGSSSTADMLIGADAANIFNITGANSGNVNGTFGFSSIENLMGGKFDDSFNFQGTGFIVGVIAGGQGANTLDYSGRHNFTGSRITVNLQTSSATAIGGGFLNISNFVGTPKPGGSSSIEPDTLIGVNSGNTFDITGTDTGTVTNLNGQVSFADFENLYGGTGVDVFRMETGGSSTGVVNGWPAAVQASGNGDWLDFSAVVTPVTANLTTGFASFFNHVFNIQNVIGGNGDPSVALGLLASTVTTTSATQLTLTTAPAVVPGELLKLDNEVVRVLSVSGKTMTVARGQLGTTATTHALGTSVFDAFANALTGAGVPTDSLGTLGATVTSLASTHFIVVNPASLIPGQYLKVNSEIVKVTAINGTQLTVARAQLGTKAAIHAVGTNLFSGGPTDGNILVGGDGADLITGGNGRSLLIGGLGVDTVTGGAAQDIVIGSNTDYDHNLPALASILAEWQTSTSIQTRTNHIRLGGGLNGSNVLVADVTVHNDLATDVIRGGAGPNWLWGQPAELKDKTSSDIVDVPVHNLPVLTGVSAVTFNIGKSAITVNGGITLTSVTSPTLFSATVKISGNYNPTEDSLGFSPSLLTGNIVGSFNRSTGTLTLTSAGGTATVQQFQNALREIQYGNSSQTPTLETRSVDFQVFDGFNFSNTLTSTIHLNYPPSVAIGSTIVYHTLQAPTVINPVILVGDPDTTTLAFATVKISAFYQPPQDILSFVGNANTGDIVGNFDPTTGTLTLTAAGLPATVAQYQAALRAVTYENLSNFPLQVNRTVLFQVSDGFTTSNVVTSTIKFA
jgi:hypothetical protein